MESKRSIKRTVLGCVLFVLIFLILLTAATIVFLPKWPGNDSAQMRGFYQEEEQSIDVLMLGSCNMYSSYSPILAYEEYGIASYGFCCPDQEICTAYHYLVDALKTQDIKVVVLESLFLTCDPTGKREYYNRLALEYMPLSMNKLSAVIELGSEESAYMQTIDSSAPDQFSTIAGYLFPLLRYHSRDDLEWNDVTALFTRDNYSKYKGGVPLFDYLRNESLDLPTVNGTGIRDFSKEYFIKIKKLCEEKGIEFLLVMSPNHYRWNDELNKKVHAFAEEMEVPLVDFFDGEYNFDLYDYSSTTGRLNIYGMKKFSSYLGAYLLEHYDIPQYSLSAENAKRWDECVQYVYDMAREENMNIDEGQIARIVNEVDGVHIMWNAVSDAETYAVYRSDGHSESYTLLAEVSGTSYLDTNVEHDQGYSYYVVPEQGRLEGVASESSYYIFLNAPVSFTAETHNGEVQLCWDSASEGAEYNIQRRDRYTINYELWDTTTKTEYLNSKCDSGTLYYYRLRTMRDEDGKRYFSAAEEASAIPVTTPAITAISAVEGKITIKWQKIQGGTEWHLYRKTESEQDFVLLDTLDVAIVSYTDTDITPGIEYFYKLVLAKKTMGRIGESEFSNTVGAIAK